MRSPFATILVLLSLVAWPAASEAPKAPPADQPTRGGTWKQIDDEDGIKVWKLEIPGVEMPGFRGEVVIDVPAERIEETLKQVDRHTEWMHNCEVAEVVKHFDADHEIVYNRTNAPWPVWDRDVILDTQFTHEADRIVLRFKNTNPKLRPLPARVVRMPRLEGSYIMWRLGPNKTRVQYTVEADVGGSLPAWLAERVAKDMPYETLSRLRKRVTGKK